MGEVEVREQEDEWNEEERQMSDRYHKLTLDPGSISMVDTREGYFQCLQHLSQVVLHTMACVYMISCYVITEWRSHSWHYFLVENSSECKPTKHPPNLYQMYSM